MGGRGCWPRRGGSAKSTPLYGGTTPEGFKRRVLVKYASRVSALSIVAAMPGYWQSRIAIGRRCG